MKIIPFTRPGTTKIVYITGQVSTHDKDKKEIAVSYGYQGRSPLELIVIATANAFIRRNHSYN